MPTLEQLLEDYARGDLDDAQLSEWFVLDDENSGPFSPTVRPSADVQITRGSRGLRGGLTIALNAASRRRRRSIFEDRIARGFTGLKVISEGDSWFQLPVLVKDVVDHLIDDETLAILSLGAAGDKIESMVRRGELVTQVRRHLPDVVLISAGGNDVLADGGLESRLRDGGNSRSPDDWIARFFYSTLDEVLLSYDRLLADVTAASPTTRVFVHGYDYARPQPGGRWLGRAFENRSVRVRSLQGQIIKTMLNAFNERLEELASTYSNVIYINVRNTVTGGQWFDELHPDSAGFERIAVKIKREIR